MGFFDRLRGKDGRPAREWSGFNPFDAKQTVVAYSIDAHFILTRVHGKLTVWAGDGTRLSERAALVARDDCPSSRHAISPSGDMLAEADDASIRVTSLRSNKVLWQAAGRLWGDPVFSPDNTLIALPLQGQVALLDARKGTEIAIVGTRENWVDTPVGRYRYTPAQGITLARGIYFSPDSRRLAVTCEANDASPSNHTAFVAEVRTGKIVAELVGHARWVADVHFLPSAQVATIDGNARVRVFGMDGLLRRVLPPVAGIGTVTAPSLAVANDVSLVLARNSEGAVFAWRSPSSRVVKVRDKRGIPVAFVGLDTATQRIVVLEREGKLELLPLPDSLESSPTLTWDNIEPSLERAKAEAAIWFIDEQRSSTALDCLRPFARDDKHHRLAAAFHYASWMAQGKESKLSAYWAANGAENIPTAGLLSLAEQYIDCSFLEQGIDLLAVWLNERKKGKATDTEDAAAREAGLTLAGRLGLIDADEPKVAILRALRAFWPHDARVNDDFIEAIRYDEPEEALKVARSLTEENPAEASGWMTLVDLLVDEEPDAVPAVVAQASKTLDMTNAATWNFIGYANVLQHNDKEALAAFQRALQIDPDNPEAAHRIKWLTEERH